MRNRLVCLCLLLLSSMVVYPQQATTSPASNVSPGVVPRIIRFSGTLKDTSGKPLSGTVGIMFALYKDQQGGAPIWMEVQNITADKDGKYTALLGATKTSGMPIELFSSAEAQWLGVHVQGQPDQPRVLLVSVPYALKAAEADTLAGHSATEFVTTEKLTTAVEKQFQQSGFNTAGNKAKALAASGATTFTDTNTTQVVAVNQQGSGKALVATAVNNTAISGTSTATTGSAMGVYGASSSPSGVGIFGAATAKTGTAVALFGSVAASGGTAVAANASSTTGNTIGLQTTVFSPTGVAALFSNAAGGPLFYGYNGTGSTRVLKFSVDGSGNTMLAGSINAPNTTATHYFAGNVGIGTSTPSTSFEVAGPAKFDNVINFSGSQTFAGANVTGTVPNATHASNADLATTATTAATAASVLNGVYTTGSYADPSWITSLSSSKLSGTASKSQLMPSVVYNDQDNTYSAGKQDFSGALSTLPIKAVLTAATPTACIGNKELLVKTDATPGQQLFICNNTNNGWNLIGDGAIGATVAVGAPLSGNGSSGSPLTLAPANASTNGYLASGDWNNFNTKLAPNGDGSLLTNINAATLQGYTATNFPIEQPWGSEHYIAPGFGVFQSNGAWPTVLEADSNPTSGPTRAVAGYVNSSAGVGGVFVNNATSGKALSASVGGVERMNVSDTGLTVNGAITGNGTAMQNIPGVLLTQLLGNSYVNSATGAGYFNILTNYVPPVNVRAFTFHRCAISATGAGQMLAFRSAIRTPTGTSGSVSIGTAYYLDVTSAGTETTFNENNDWFDLTAGQSYDLGVNFAPAPPAGAGFCSVVVQLFTR